MIISLCAVPSEPKNLRCKFRIEWGWKLWSYLESKYDFSAPDNLHTAVGFCDSVFRWRAGVGVNSACHSTRPHGPGKRRTRNMFHRPHLVWKWQDCFTAWTLAVPRQSARWRRQKRERERPNCMKCSFSSFMADFIHFIRCNHYKIAEKCK